MKTPTLPWSPPTEYSFSLGDYYNLIQGYFPGAQTMLWDNTFYYLDMESWGKVFKEVAVNLPKYTVDKFDCENFALLTNGRIAEKYKINSCGIAIGTSPQGEHGFNFFVADVNGKPMLYLYEPQNGMVYEPGEGYEPRLFIVG